MIVVKRFASTENVPTVEAVAVEGAKVSHARRIAQTKGFVLVRRATLAHPAMLQHSKVVRKARSAKATGDAHCMANFVEQAPSPTANKAIFARKRGSVDTKVSQGNVCWGRKK